MATLTWWVDPDVSGGLGDGSSEANAYASQNAAEAAEQMDLDAANDIGNIHCTSSGGTADTTAVIYTGWTTSSDDYILLDTKSGDEAVKTSWDSNRYRHEITDGTGIDVRQSHFRISGLQIRAIATTSTSYGVYLNTGIAAGADIRIYNSRFSNTGASTNMCIRGVDTDIVLKVWNTIFENASNDGVRLTCSTAEFYNCIVYGCGGAGLEFDVGTCTAKNCALFNNTGSDIQDDVGGSTIDYNAADDVAARGANGTDHSGADWTTEYAGYATGNFTLTSGGNCEGGGTDNPGSGLYSTDMDGDAYTSTWSIGVDAKTAAGNAPTGALEGPLYGPLAGPI